VRHLIPCVNTCSRLTSPARIMANCASSQCNTIRHATRLAHGYAGCAQYLWNAPGSQRRPQRWPVSGRSEQRTQSYAKADRGDNAFPAIHGSAECTVELPFALTRLGGEVAHQSIRQSNPPSGRCVFLMDCRHEGKSERLAFRSGEAAYHGLLQTVKRLRRLH
jgi:hypothetical protein